MISSTSTAFGASFSAARRCSACHCRPGAATTAKPPTTSAPAISKALIARNERTNCPPGVLRDRDTQMRPGKARTSTCIHIPVSNQIAPRLASILQCFPPNCAAVQTADGVGRSLCLPARCNEAAQICRFLGAFADAILGPRAARFVSEGGRQTRPLMIDTVTKPKTRVKTKTERPRMHKVILINDDYTPREFVVTVLKAEFRMTDDQAYKVMITAHRLGVCVVAVFTKDIAETKATRATDAGRAKGYPLLFTTEPEE